MKPIMLDLCEIDIDEKLTNIRVNLNNIVSIKEYNSSARSNCSIIETVSGSLIFVTLSVLEIMQQIRYEYNIQ